MSFPIHLLVRPGLAVLLSSILAGCASEVSGGGTAGHDADGGQASDGEGGGAGTGGGAGAGGSVEGAGEEPPQGLFDCGLPLVCEMTGHNVSVNGGECLAQHVLSGAPGVVSYAYFTGPYHRVDASLTIYLGDGTALVQRRAVDCRVDCEPLPWPPATQVERCDVVVPEGLAADCEANPDTCSAHPEGTVEACVPEAIPTCEEIEALLAVP